MEAESPGYGTATRLFHWTTAALVFVMVPAGVLMTSEGFPRLQDPLYVIHKGTGSFLLVLIVARAIWKLTRPRALPLPEHFPPLQRRIARGTHGLLYLLLLVQVVSGYVRTVGDGFPIEVLDALGVPPLLPEMPRAAHVMLAVHRINAYLLTAVIAVHVGAVAHHSLITRDRVIDRMWPPLRPRAAGATDTDGPRG